MRKISFATNIFSFGSQPPFVVLHSARATVVSLLVQESASSSSQKKDESWTEVSCPFCSSPRLLMVLLIIDVLNAGTIQYFSVGGANCWMIHSSFLFILPSSLMMVCMVRFESLAGFNYSTNPAVDCSLVLLLLPFAHQGGRCMICMIMCPLRRMHIIVIEYYLV